MADLTVNFMHDYERYEVMQALDGKMVDTAPVNVALMLKDKSHR